MTSHRSKTSPALQIDRNGLKCQHYSSINAHQGGIVTAKQAFTHVPPESRSALLTLFFSYALDHRTLKLTLLPHEATTRAIHSMKSPKQEHVYSNYVDHNIEHKGWKQRRSVQRLHM